MKFFALLRLGRVLVLLLAFGGMRAEATTAGFGLTLTVSTNQFFVNNTIASTITVSNGTGIVLDNVYVTNNFSAPVLYTSFTNLSTVTNNAYTNGNAITLEFSPMTNGQVSSAFFTWQPLTTGPLTNFIFVDTDVLTNTAALTNVSQVYGANADLGVSLAVVSPAYITNDFWVITNDWVTYRVTVTNLGPGTATGVLVTNALPPHVSLLSPAASIVSNQWVFAAGTLAAGTGTNYQFTVLATTNGGYPLAAAVGMPAAYDPNTNNNQAASLLYATNYSSDPLLALTNSAQLVNPQNGLIEQTILVTNPGTNYIPAVRVLVAGLTNQLYNAGATNGSNKQPFVTYPAVLAPAGRVSLRLQYAPRLPFPFTNGQLQAHGVPASVLQYTPPPGQTTTNFNYYRLVQLTDGDVLLEFTNLGSSYTVVYSDNLQFSNARIATPPVKSGANRIQWLDYGPPGTVSAPTNSTGSRFYKVILNP